MVNPIYPSCSRVSEALFSDRTALDEAPFRFLFAAEQHKLESAVGLVLLLVHGPPSRFRVVVARWLCYSYTSLLVSVDGVSVISDGRTARRVHGTAVRDEEQKKALGHLHVSCL